MAVSNKALPFQKHVEHKAGSGVIVNCVNTDRHVELISNVC